MERQDETIAVDWRWRCCQCEVPVRPDSAMGLSPLCESCGVPLVRTELSPSTPIPGCVSNREVTLILEDGTLPPRLATEFDMSVSGPDPLIGTNLGVYRIDSLLGKGGMGKVYLAHHRDLHRPCALKVLLPELMRQDREYIDRFLNEGRAAAALVHPNIVTVHAIGEEQGYNFLEMEFIAGQSLRQLVKDETRLQPLRATALAARVAEGLGAAHRERIIHHDLKPDNVLLTLQGVPKLADFGLAKRLVNGPTFSGRLCGTPNYMSPEMFDGTPATTQSDVYALGVTYYLLLTGKFPHEAKSLTELAQAVTTRPPIDVRSFVPEVPLEMAECLALLMHKSPANRPPNAIAAAQLLHAVLGEVRDLEGLLREAFADDPGVQWTGDGTCFRLDVRIDEERRQVVYVEPSHHAAAERLLLITSTCCPAVPAYYETALRINSEMNHGSIAVRDVDGSSKFVVIDTYPRATVDAEEVRRSTHSVATRADAIEKLLTGADRY